MGGSVTAVSPLPPERAVWGERWLGLRRDSPTTCGMLLRKTTREQVAPLQIAIVDNKCRILIPKEERDQLGLKPGDVVAIRLQAGVLHIRKVADPFDALAETAVAEHDAGRTHSLRDVAREMGSRKRSRAGATPTR